MPRRTCLAALALLVLPATAQPAGPKFWRLEGPRAFLDGDLSGLSVDSDGRLRLGVATRTLYDPQAPNAWCVARDAAGVLYVGTGNEGRVIRLDGEKGEVLFDAQQLEVHAVAVGKDGRVYAATSPDGAVYAIDKDGKASVFFDPKDRYIWALATDADGRLYVATGAEGHVYRVERDGSATTVLTTAQTHVLSLALDARGRVYAGTAPDGIVYRIDPAGGRAFVLLDSAFHEIKALDVGDDGVLYAAAVDGRAPGAAPPQAASAAPAAAPATGTTAEVTVVESFAAVPPTGGAVVPLAPAAETPTTGAPRGALLRVHATGEVDTLWSSTDDTPYSVRRVAGGVLVGTGSKGKLYRVADDGSWALVATLPAGQVTALVRESGAAVALVTANPARVVSIDTALATEGTFVSKPQDTQTLSRWGRISWEGSAPAGTAVRLQTRSGNTETPDDTWTEWSSPATSPGGEPVTSDPARFLQLKVTLVGREGTTPVVNAVATAYLQRNLPPEVRSIKLHPPGEVFQKPISVSGDIEILGLAVDPLSDRSGASRPAAGMPPAVSFSRKLYQHGLQTVSWQADDPNGDTLVFEVDYRATSDRRFRPLASGLTEPVFAFDTSTVPNGRYVLRIVASDAPDNPPALARNGWKDSPSFLVDNAPPSVEARLDPAGGVVRATVRDDASPISKLEYSVDAGRWQEIHPVDGIADSLLETYAIPLSVLEGSGPHVMVLRASDLLGNMATARVDTP
jgi:outer membrane protein assembly factor BamB